MREYFEKLANYVVKDVKKRLQYKNPKVHMLALRVHFGDEAFIGLMEVKHRKYTVKDKISRGLRIISSLRSFLIPMYLFLELPGLKNPISKLPPEETMVSPSLIDWFVVMAEVVVVGVKEVSAKVRGRCGGQVGGRRGSASDLEELDEGEAKSWWSGHWKGPRDGGRRAADAKPRSIWPIWPTFSSRVILLIKSLILAFKGCFGSLYFMYTAPEATTHKHQKANPNMGVANLPICFMGFQNLLKIFKSFSNHRANAKGSHTVTD
ncbi:hypothetical protein RJ640_009706 [Escallonia rubra]|uniref:Uncharacterized protein n=1 Tax=Escallonia rubra TaxID=112253 RepID=A0AA88QSR9_9ASTE|nr:hypothetical protein RJ640_009706 [Escallonia rubra]